MTAIREPYRYISEATWLPSYIGIAAIALGTIKGAWLSSAAVLVGLLVFRMALELVYRFAFGDARLQIRTQLFAFAAQLILWVAVGWYWTAS